MTLMARARAAQAEARRRAETARRESLERNKAETERMLIRLLSQRLGITDAHIVDSLDLLRVAEVEGIRFTASHEYYYDLPAAWELRCVVRCKECGKDTAIGWDIGSLEDLAGVADWYFCNKALCDTCREAQREKEANDSKVCPLMAIANQLGRTSDSCEREQCAWWTGTVCAVKGIAQLLDIVEFNEQVTEGAEPNCCTS